MMSISKISISCAACMAVIILATGCNNDMAVFDELESNRLKVVFKGSFASNSPAEEWILPANSEDILIKDDSIVLCDESLIVDDPATVDVDESTQARVKMPTKFMIDIAELKLNQDDFSNYRRAKTFDIDNTPSDGIPDTENFFNGNGVTLANDDPIHLKEYSYLRLNTRKMSFDNAKVYQLKSGGWEFYEDSEIIFNEKENVSGFNINPLQVNAYYDSLREEASHINRVYPTRIRIVGGMVFNRNKDQTVLEVRILVKNFIKKYEYRDYVDSKLRATHFYGFSDWLREVGPGEQDIGGNIIGVARAYNPELVGSISGTRLTTGNSIFVIAIPAGDLITRYALVDPLANYSGTNQTITESAEGDGTYQITTADHTAQFFVGDYIQLDPWETPKSGTYTWSADVVTITTTTHGYRVGDYIYIDFTSGGGTPDANYRVTSVPSPTTFTVTLAGSGADGNVTTSTTRITKKYFITDVTLSSISFIARPGYGDGIPASSSYHLYPASSRETNPCDLPQSPEDISVDFDSYLDYLTSREQYRTDWNNSISVCNDMELLDSDWTAFTNYQEAWNNYEDSVEDIILPPLAAYIDDAGTSYTLENVAAGDYDIYYTNIDVSDANQYGKLFYTHNFTFAQTINVGEKQAVMVDIP